MISIRNGVRAIVLLMALTCHAGSYALTFSFEGYTGVLDSNTLTLPFGTFTGEHGLFASAVPSPAFNFPIDGTVCGTNVAMTDCEGDLLLTFTEPMENLSFESFVTNEGDLTIISIFSDDTLLSSQTLLSDRLIDFSDFSGITSVFFEDFSTGGGYRYGNFSFELSPAPVPVPGALPLLLSALIGSGWCARRRS